MTEASKYLAILCGEFNDDYKPLTRAYFWNIYHENDNNTENIINSNNSEISQLLKRSGSVMFAVDKLQGMGIGITTFLDDDFPHTLLSKLGDKCPPLLYYCGNPVINKQRLTGFAGSRDINENDILWTEKMVTKVVAKKRGVVSGGAKGIDTLSVGIALKSGCCCIEFIAEGIDKRITEEQTLNSVLDGSLLLYSAVSPFAKKTRNSYVAAAMERNKFIYAQSSSTIIVKTGYKQGGTWTGATEALKNKYSNVFVWDTADYPGNKALIEKGAVGIDDNGEISVKNNTVYSEMNIPYQQMSLLESIG